MTITTLRPFLLLLVFAFAFGLHAQKGGLLVTDIPDPVMRDFPVDVSDGTFYNLTPNNTLVYKDGGTGTTYRTDGTIAGSGEILDGFSGFFLEPIGASDSSAWFVHDFSQLLRFGNVLNDTESTSLNEVFYSGISLDAEPNRIVATNDRVYAYDVRPLFSGAPGRYIMELLEYRYGENSYNTLFSDTVLYDPFLSLVYQLGEEVVFSRYADLEDSQVGISLWAYSPVTDSIREISSVGTGTNWLRLTRTGDYLYGRSETGADVPTLLLIGEGYERVKEIELPSRPGRVYHLEEERFVYEAVGGLAGLDVGTGESELINLVAGQFNSFSLLGKLRGSSGFELVFEEFNNASGSRRIYRTNGTLAGTSLLFELGELDLPPGFVDLAIAINNIFISVHADTLSALFNYYPPTGELGQVDLPLAFEDFRIYPQEDHLFLFGVTQETMPFTAQYATASISSAPGGILRARVFRDLNGDGIAQVNEPAMPNYAIKYTGDGTTGRLFSNQNGSGKLFTRAGVEYNITPVAPQCFEITTDSSLTFRATSTNNVFFNLGFKPSEMQEPSVNGGVFPYSASRCGFQNRVAFRVVNDGCNDLENVETSLTLPEGVTLIGAPDPVPTIATDTSFGWLIDSLKIGQAQTFELTLQMPGEDATGQALSWAAEIEAFDPSTSTTVHDTLVYTDTLRCAIDPNDKQVQPSRPEPSNSNYTQFDETLTYTVRFQNTGNDTAFTVRIEDQLAENLDWETFKPVTASHPYSATLTEDGLATFLFEDILLPDSTTNELLSHGFVTFEIRAKADPTPPASSSTSTSRSSPIR